MNTTPTLRPYGEHALLIELADNAQAQAVAWAARRHWGDQLAEVVPGHRSVLLAWHLHRPALDAVTSDLEQLASADCPGSDARAPGDESETVTIPTIYDGADLDAVAETLGLSSERVIERHTAPLYTVAFIGFMPGFPYLLGGDPRLLALPRLATPRIEVRAGSVAVAAGYCGIYPRAAPGGWNLLGRTDAQLFIADRDRPALLTPGMRVRFERT